MPTRITDTLSVAPQPATAGFAALRAAGFAAIVNNRPDDEEAGQPNNAAERAAAEDAGLGYSFIPVTGGTITDADIRAFGAAVAAAGGPVLAHCRSGMRSLTLHALGEVLDGRLPADDIVPFGRAHGADLSGAAAWLARYRARRPQVTGFHDARTCSIQYVAADPETGQCAIIDPVLDFDEKSGSVATENADAIRAFVAGQRLTVAWILDTHPHADHLTAAAYLKEKTGAPIAIGERVVEMQRLWAAIYNLPALSTGGAAWDRLFADGDRFAVGGLEGRVLLSPGHTPASVTYRIGDAAFVHDTLFMPDGGTARTDFPGADARRQWASIRTILSLPDDTRLFTGHDYRPAGRAARWESGIAEQQRGNAHLAGRTEEAFVAFRQARDRALPMPKLILPALQVNLRAGRLPDAEDDGGRYLKLPIGAFPGAPW